MNTDDVERNHGSANEGALASLVIPEDMVDKVLEFVESLQSSDEEVSGYMFSGALTGGFSGAVRT